MKKTNNFPKKAIILAGGKGTRLYPITKEIPKPLLPIKKKPIINYLIELFQNYGIKDIAVLISKDFKEDFKWWEKRYYNSVEGLEKNPEIKLIEETKPLGTFGGLYFLKEWIGNDLFFLTNGDELKKINLVEMNQFHQEIKVPATIALIKVSDPEHYGVAICENNKIDKFLEKPQNPPSQYVNSGIYLLSPEIFNYHSGPQFAMIEKDLFPKLAQEKKLAGFKFEGKWMDCGNWERYEKALNEWE
jgi:mannose-1-phosphate guanylyltransferase